MYYKFPKITTDNKVEKLVLEIAKIVTICLSVGLFVLTFLTFKFLGHKLLNIWRLGWLDDWVGFGAMYVLCDVISCWEKKRKEQKESKIKDEMVRG